MPLQINFCFDLFHNKKKWILKFFFETIFKIIQTKYQNINFFFIFDFLVVTTVSHLYFVLSFSIRRADIQLFHHTIYFITQWGKIYYEVALEFVRHTYEYATWCHKKFSYLLSVLDRAKVFEKLLWSCVYSKIKFDFKIILAPLCIASQIANL